MLLRGMLEYARKPRRFICAPTRCIHYARAVPFPGRRSRASFPPPQNSIFQKPVFQKHPYWDPVQTPPGWGFLGYKKSITTEFYIPEACIPEGSLLGSCTSGSRMGSSGIRKFHRNMNSIFQIFLFHKAPYLDLVQTVPRWNALEYGNSTTAELYIPEAYIPKRSFLGSCTNGFRMGPAGI